MCGPLKGPLWQSNTVQRQTDRQTGRDREIYREREVEKERYRKRERDIYK